MITDYINRQYGVPARIGGRVSYTGIGKPQHGTIVSVDGARLRIKLDDKPDFVGLYHPTWELEYLASEPPAIVHDADCLSFSWSVSAPAIAAPAGRGTAMAERDLFDAVAETARMKIQETISDLAVTDSLCERLIDDTAFIALCSGASAAIANTIRALVHTNGIDGDVVIAAMTKQLTEHWQQANSPRRAGGVQ
jgi:hypothetical protein